MSNTTDLNVVCRGAKSADAVVLARFAHRTFTETYAAVNRPEDIAIYLEEEFGLERQRASLADPDINTLLCQVDDELAGYVELRQSPVPACLVAEYLVEIRRFYVDKPWQGRGVASKLMDAVFSTATAMQARGVWLGVWENNTRAQAFYSKHGFTRVGEQVFKLGSALQTDFIMMRRLT